MKTKTETLCIVYYQEINQNFMEEEKKALSILLTVSQKKRWDMLKLTVQNPENPNKNMSSDVLAVFLMDYYERNEKEKE